MKLNIKNNSKYALVALLPLTIGALSACGKGFRREKVEVNLVSMENFRAKKEIKISLWTATKDDSDQAKTMNAYIESFKEFYSNVSITVDNQGNGYPALEKSVSEAISIGKSPTMAVTYPDHVVGYLTGDAIVPLDDYISADDAEISIDKDNFIDAYLDENTNINGVEGTFGLPFSKSSEVLVYNKTFFEANQQLDVPKTWDEVVDVAQKISDIVNEGLTFDPSNPDSNWVYPFAYDSADNLFITLTKQWGGTYTSLNNKLAFYEDENSRAALKFFQDAAKEGLFALPDTFDERYASTPFINKQTYMVVSSSVGAAHNIPTNEPFDVGFAAVPQNALGGNKAVISQGPNISILADSDDYQRQAAWLFLKHITDTENVVDWSINTGYLPTTKSALESEKYRTYLESADDEETTTVDKARADAAKVCMEEQSDYQFTDIPFEGSSNVRAAVKILTTSMMVGKFDSVDSAYRRAYESLRDIV